MCLYYHCQQVGVIMLLILCSLCCGVNCDDTSWTFLVFFYSERFFHKDCITIATVYALISYPSTKVFAFKQLEGNGLSPLPLLSLSLSLSNQHYQMLFYFVSCQSSWGHDDCMSTCLMQFHSSCEFLFFPSSRWFQDTSENRFSIRC